VPTKAAHAAKMAMAVNRGARRLDSIAPSICMTETAAFSARQRYLPSKRKTLQCRKNDTQQPRTHSAGYSRPRESRRRIPGWASSPRSSAPTNAIGMNQCRPLCRFRDKKTKHVALVELCCACAGFRTPEWRDYPRMRAAGAGKAPRQEIAVGGAPGGAAGAMGIWARGRGW
jgi:hypothetical protein